MGTKRNFIIAANKLCSVDYVDIMRMEMEHNDGLWNIRAVLYNGETVAIASRNDFGEAYKAVYEVLKLVGSGKDHGIIQMVTQEEAAQYQAEKEAIEKSPDGEKGEQDLDAGE